MKKLCLLLACAITVLITSCGKNKNFPSTPRLTFKSISPQSLSNNSNDSTLTIVCSFKDAEGDITGPVYFMQSNNTDIGYDSLYSLPGLPARKNMEGDIILQLGSNDIYFPGGSSVDTVTFSLYIKDEAGHTSDTVKTSKVVLISN